MRILKMNLKKGKMTLLLQDPDDLWHLKHVLEQGDLLTAKTMRKTTIKSGGEIRLGEKKPVTLTIKAEKIEFQKDVQALRAMGKIVSGPETIQLSAYHTLQLKPNSILTIQKEWKRYQLERLKKAQIKRPLLFICVLDREEANFAVLKESGIELHGSIRCRDPEQREGYYKDILNYLEKEEGFQHIVVGGPGFERENLFNFIKAKNPELAKLIILEHCAYTGIHGIQEVIKSSANRILKETRIAKESELVNELFKRIKLNSLAVYGVKETEQAVNIGAVDTLLVSSEKVPDFERLMEATEKQRGKIVIITSDHELGEQFLNLGGIAALLRFRIS